MNIKAWLGLKPTQKSVKEQIATGLALLVIMVSSGMMGSFVGYYQAVGELPFVRTEAVLPDVPEDTTTLIDVGHFLERDKTDELDYGEDVNCVEYAILTARNAHWNGIPAEPGALVYEDGSKHMILIFPTAENGWVFVDPQADLVINPRVGAMYSGKRVVEISILEVRWVPFEVSK